MFVKLADTLSGGDFLFEGFYVYVLYHGTMLDVGKMLEKLWSYYFYNVIVVLEVEKVVNVVSFELFSSSKCGVLQPIILNYYQNKTFLYVIRDFFPRKFKNLFNCPIRIAGIKTTPSLLEHRLANGSNIMTGIDWELMKHLEAMFNFQLVLIFDKDKIGEIFDNGTSTGIIKKTMDGNYEMIFGNMFLTPNRLKYLSTSKTYFSMPIVLVVPTGPPFTSFEKLFKPFHLTVWMFLIGIFMFGIIIIFLIKRQLQSVQNFMFGKRITNQYTNLLLIFVGGSQHLLPQHNFARYLLMLFILFCMIQRTLYQGSLYKFLQSDNRAAEVKSIDEMINHKFYFYMYYTTEMFTKYSKIYDR